MNGGKAGGLPSSRNRSIAAFIGCGCRTSTCMSSNIGASACAAGCANCSGPTKLAGRPGSAQQIRARGIRTPEPLGWADGGIITRTERGMSLLNFIESSPNEPRVTHRFAAALGRFVAALHAAGVVHHDPHPGNLIIDCDGDEPRFALLDLHAVKLGPPCTWAERRENLILFNRFFMLRASRAERLRFWRAYCDASSGAIGLPADQAGRDVERRTLESNLEFWKARDRRCLVSNRYYRRVHSGNAGGVAVRDLDESLVAQLLRDPDRPFRDASLKIKDSRSSTVIELPAARAIFKRFRVTDARDPWLALLRRTPVIRSWIMGHGLSPALLADRSAASGAASLSPRIAVRRLSANREDRERCRVTSLGGSDVDPARQRSPH